MPFIEVNGANLYYETFGKDQPDKAPIILIHGSTGTGKSNWQAVAPALALYYRVIVPDCRGHGQSSNPQQSYTFREMAADMAGLVRALGYERAHVIGHSNGGNVALVTLVEHPEVVQTAILQAANAWVSPDLLEREPSIFDPDRVQRENPEWMQNMIALHGPTHGPDYWRDLLQMTVKELISEPNYTPQDLQRVQRPSLVIQGENDRVNAPYEHAQFIARHIPDAELWIPVGVGHTVHDEVFLTWMEKVLDFLRRRGDDANDVLYRFGKQRYPDRRLTVFEVRAQPHADSKQSRWQLSGQVLLEEQRQAAQAVAGEKVSANHIQALLDETTPWALINRGVTDLRRKPSIFSERVSQVLLGEAVRIMREEGDWSWVRMEKDGYLGWVQKKAMHTCSQADVIGYQKMGNVIVRAGIARGYVQPEVEADGTGLEAGRLPFGVQVPMREKKGDLCSVQLPDGSCWWVAENDLLPLLQRPALDRVGITQALALMQRFVGVPYLWGGRTTFGFDCSGFAQTFLNFLGIAAPRDADQQFQAGQAVDGESLPGDLLFFGEPREEGAPLQSIGNRDRRITHVGISLGRDRLIHSNGSAWGVSYSSLEPGQPAYDAWLHENLAGARRFV